MAKKSLAPGVKKHIIELEKVIRKFQRRVHDMEDSLKANADRPEAITTLNHMINYRQKCIDGVRLEIQRLHDGGKIKAGFMQQLHQGEMPWLR